LNELSDEITLGCILADMLNDAADANAFIAQPFDLIIAGAIWYRLAVGPSICPAAFLSGRPGVM